MRTLAPLVPASVHGVLCDVTIAAVEGLEGVAEIADHAGCRLETASDAGAAVQAACRLARREHVLLLAAGWALTPGFHQELDGWFRAGAHHCLIREEARGLIGRLLPNRAPLAALTAKRRELADIAGDIANGPAGLGRISARLPRGRTLAARAIRLDILV